MHLSIDSEYRPNPRDIDIFWPTAHYSTSISISPLHFILSGKNIESKHSVGFGVVTCIRCRPFKILFMLVISLLACGQTPYRWVGELPISGWEHSVDLTIHGTLTPKFAKSPLYPREGWSMTHNKWTTALLACQLISSGHISTRPRYANHGPYNVLYHYFKNNWWVWLKP